MRQTTVEAVTVHHPQYIRAKRGVSYPLALVVVGLALILSGCSEMALRITNNVSKNPCPEVMTDRNFQDFQSRLTAILSDKAGVLQAISDQIQQAGGRGTVSVDINLVTQAEYRDEQSIDLADGGPPPTAEEVTAYKQEADSNWKGFDAETYDTYKYSKPSRLFIKTRIFCKPSVQDRIVHNSDAHMLDRLIIHELVHAMWSASIEEGANLQFNIETPPPKNHPEDFSPAFSKEVDQLTAKLLTSLQ